MAPLRRGFDGPIKLEFHGAKITRDEGSLVYHELNDAFILLLPRLVTVLTSGPYTTHSRLGHYEDLNDAERLRVDTGWCGQQ